MLFVDAGSDAVGVNTSSPKNDVVMEIRDGGLATNAVLRVSADDSAPYALVVANNAHSTTTADGLAMWMGTSSKAFIDVRGGSGQALGFRLGGTEELAITQNGITFNGDTAAANALDDYEEGAFSPMTSTLATVYHARYTKIGNLVTINCNFQMKAGQSRDFISLPFTPNNDGTGMNTATNDATNNRYAGTVSYFTPSGGSTPLNLMLYNQGNQGAAAFFISKNSTTQQSWPKAVDDTFGNIAVSFTYQTS